MLTPLVTVVTAWLLGGPEIQHYHQAIAVVVAETFEQARAAAVAGRVSAWADRHYGAALAAAQMHRALGNALAWQDALEQARRLAGERALPEAVLAPPS